MEFHTLIKYLGTGLPTAAQTGIYFKSYFPEMLMLLPILLLASLEAFPVATWTESDRGPMIQPSLT